MTTQATLADETNACGQVLYMALELSDRTWKVLFAAPSGRRRERSLAARDIEGLVAEIAEAKRKLGLSPNAGVVSCYEAGRDGFWLHRALEAGGVANLVVDSSSIEVPQRARRLKTDRIDLVKLMALLLRYVGGERGVWSVVRVPDVEVEDVRQLSRGIDRLKCERGRHIARLKSLLVKEGIKGLRIGGSANGLDWAERVGQVRLWDGSPQRPRLMHELILEGERLALVERQLALLKAEREALVASSDSRVAGATRRLRELGAIAEESSFVFSTEVLGWRTFANRRELAGALGVTGSPFNSGNSEREQGISKAGNRRMRAMLMEIAWCWLRYQPKSALSRWFQRRFAHGPKKGNSRLRRIGIVALARKLLVALWRYLEEGLVPEGASLKTPKTRRAAA
jgi:transposase